EGIVVRQAARQVHHDDGLVRRPAALLVGLQNLWQTQAAHRQRADLQKRTPADAVAVPMLAPYQRQHGAPQFGVVLKSSNSVLSHPPGWCQGMSGGAC